MICYANEIREQIRKQFDGGLFGPKLSKTALIKDKQFFCPSIVGLQDDYNTVKKDITNQFGLPPHKIMRLASNPKTIYDCDNMARKLRVALNDLHYAGYREGIHDIPHEYAVFQITIKNSPMFDLAERIRTPYHDLCMVFTVGGICFADLMQDKVWPIINNKPDVVNIV